MNVNEVPPTNSGTSKTKRPFPWTWIILALVLSAPILLVGSFLAGPLMIIHEADAGFRKAKKTIDPERLRSWALDSIKWHSGTNGFSENLPISKIPDYITNLYSIPPEDAWITPKTADHEASVGIIWGGGFFHWGLFVGPTNYLMYPDGNHQIAEWVSGIYYMHEGGRKIR